jgi:hypothetical protein
MPKKGMTIFISYVEEDKEMAEKLYKDIKNHGYQPWIESKDLLAGQKKDLEKQKALKQADFCLVLLSKTSISKPGDAQKEQTTALGLLDQFPESDNYLIPVRLNDCELPMRLSNLKAVDMFYDYEDGLNRLLKSFKQKQQAIQPKDSNHLFLQNNTMIKKTKKCAIEIKTNCSADIFLKHISDNSRVKAIGTTKKNSLLSKYILTSEQDPGKYEIIASAKNTEKSIKIILSPMKNSETIVFHFDINLKYLVILVVILFGLIVNNVYKYGIFFSDQNKTKNMILIPEGSFLKGGEDDKNLPLLRLIRRYRDQPDIVKKLANIKPQKIFLPTYYIDINEVTNFDYEKFLSDKNANKFNHNEQPSTKKTIFLNIGMILNLINLINLLLALTGMMHILIACGKVNNCNQESNGKKLPAVMIIDSTPGGMNMIKQDVTITYLLFTIQSLSVVILQEQALMALMI